jgi:hypothetical protein
VASQLGHLASRPPIVADGAPAPPMTSFTTSKAFSKLVDVTSVHDATLVGCASLNGGIILAMTAVDRALKGSMAREVMKKALEEK